MSAAPLNNVLSLSNDSLSVRSQHPRFQEEQSFLPSIWKDLSSLIWFHSMTFPYSLMIPGTFFFPGHF